MQKFTHATTYRQSLFLAGIFLLAGVHLFAPTHALAVASVPGIVANPPPLLPADPHTQPNFSKNVNNEGASTGEVPAGDTVRPEVKPLNELSGGNPTAPEFALFSTAESSSRLRIYVVVIGIFLCVGVLIVVPLYYRRKK